ETTVPPGGGRVSFRQSRGASNLESENPPVQSQEEAAHGDGHDEALPRPARQFPVVGMGASGGLEAFQRFFDPMPPDSGTVFVLILHLDPRHEAFTPEPLAPNTQMPADHLARICALVRRKTGHDFTHYKPATIVRRIQRRMQLLQTPTVSVYVERLHRDGEELEQLFKDLLIGVTHFFRDPQAFEFMGKEVIPRIIALATDAVR